MPLLFERLCDLLSHLEDVLKRDPPLLPAVRRQRTNDTIKAWFISHRVSINSPEIDAVALLSALFPSKRTDRVYHIQPPGLTRSLRRWLCLGSSRWPILDQWQKPGGGDLSDCVERAQQQAEFPKPHSRNAVTLEQVDDALATVAAQCRYSAPSVRAREIQEDAKVSNALKNIYHRLQSREAKWFTRLILKDFSCLDLPEDLILACTDPRLRVAMQMYHDFDSAINELRNLPTTQLAVPWQASSTHDYLNNVNLLPPKLGIKLGPPKWVKAKGGVKHAVTVIGGRNMSVQRKHDGEYCQIHVDLSKGEDCIQIFSKSGKDSTEDRKGVHKAIKDGLRIGRQNCRFSANCILEGELLVYSDRTKEILDFHKIRKHVSRSGSFLGTALDSQPHYWEHLVIMFYDVMLIDDNPILHRPYGERRSRLEKLVKQIEGRSDCTWQTRVPFSTPDGPQRLKKELALAFGRRWEGLVLKPYDESYFDLAKPARGNFPSRWIKLKKDCIKGLGDSADFAVIGGSYDAGQAAKYPDLKLQWTRFHIGCLQNKRDVLDRGAKPHLFAFDVVSDCITRKDLKTLNEHGYLRAMKPSALDTTNLFDIKYATGITRPSNIFRIPFVFDIAGSGFDKSPNREIFTLRFPRVMRIHWDREWKEAVSLEELQEMATEARKVPPESSMPDEVANREAKLDRADKMSNGRLNSWDYSDDEAEEMFVSPTPKMSQTAVASYAGRRTNKLAAAPLLVRMDTGEMRQHERRLSSGEVVERPTSKNSMSSITSDGSLQTPPTSSPLAKGSDSMSLRQILPDSGGHQHDRTKKRSAAAIDDGEASRRLKKARSELKERPKEPPNDFSSSECGHNHKKARSELKERPKEPPNDFSSSECGHNHKKALCDITNSARPSSASLDSTPKPNQPPSAKDFSLVRKLPTSMESLDSERHSKRRRIMEPSSPARETTASETTSPASTQQADTQVSASEVSATREIHPENVLELPTPPSTANPSTKIELPDLQHSRLSLSPHLMNNVQLIEPLKGLLASLQVYYPSFRHAICDSSSANTIISTVKEPVQFILLVDSEDSDATSTAMVTSVASVPACHPIPLAVWDWGILEVLLRNELGVEEADGMVFREYFCAKLVWNANLDGEGDVEVRWRDGPVERWRSTV